MTRTTASSPDDHLCCCGAPACRDFELGRSELSLCRECIELIVRAAPDDVPVVVRFGDPPRDAA